MNTFALFAFLCGAVLAFRYRVFILYPIIGFGAIFTLVLGSAAGRSLESLLLGIVAVGVAFQIGYLFGGVVRGTLVAARMAVRRRTVPAKQPTQTA
jgi:hypothetical protein